MNTQNLDQILISFNQEIVQVDSFDQLEQIKKEFLGKDSILTSILKSMKTLSENDKQTIGKQSNEIRQIITDKINAKSKEINQEKINKILLTEQIDLTKPGLEIPFGTKHPLNLVIEEITDIFTEIGFEMIEGTEVDTDEFNFQKLNLPIGHPARDMQDTFYITEETVLRTHSTNMTAHMFSQLATRPLEEQTLAAISYGNVFRRDDDDATHSHQFMQIDGFAISKTMSFSNLKWILKYMCRRLFSETVNIRMRPSFFPFTEPSVEVDVSCFKCNGVGCTLCKNTGWIEILGAGMVNQQVLEANGLDYNELNAFAFGIGIERIAMLKFGINNIRHFYDNNLNFLNQFKFYGK